MNQKTLSQETTLIEEPPLLASVQEKKWNDWRWQISNSITKIEINSDEKLLNLPIRITPYYMNVIKNSIQLQKTMIPSINEFEKIGEEDPLKETENMPVKNLVHKYPDRVLFLTTNFCSTNCRYSLHEDTNILMSDFSFKKIKDVNIGDNIITHAGNIKKVYETFNREYSDSLLEIKTSRNLKIITTKEHPFLIIKKKDILCNCGNDRACKPNSEFCKTRHKKWQHDFIPKYKYASEIEIGDYVATPIMKNINDYKYNNVDLAYLMGVYLAEGDIPKRKNDNNIGCVRLSLGSHELEFVERIKKTCDSLGLKLTVNLYENRSIHSLHILNSELCKTFERELGRLSYNKHISEDILYNSSDDFKYFLLLGMFHGDGCIWKQSNSYGLSFNTTSETLSNQIFMMLNKLGFMCSIYKHDCVNKIRKAGYSNKIKNLNKTVISKHINHSVRIGNNIDIEKFLKYNINSNITGTSSSFMHNNFLFSRVNTINTLPEKLNIVYDLSIEDDESFVANFFTVHNCTRSRIFNDGNSEIETNKWDEALKYISEHTEIRDVLLSGGDPLTLSDESLEYILTELKKIKHVEMIRIGTKVPMVLPQRITPELTNMLKKYHPLFMSIHVTHPDEFTEETKKALNMLADAGIPLGSQTVLLKDINDDVSIMKRLMHLLLMNRVRPYYLYSADRVSGTSHFWTSIDKGLEIISSLRGYTTGYAVPQFIVDSAKGKIAINPNNIIEKTDNKIVLKSYDGELIEFLN